MCLIGETELDLAGRVVLLVDDIVDTGRTLLYARDLLRERKAASVFTCTLVDKPSRREVAIDLDFVGFTIPDVFVVGYGPRTTKARSKLRATGGERSCPRSGHLPQAQCRRARSARRNRFLDCLLQQPAPTLLALAQSLYGPSQISARQPDPRRFPLVTIASRFIARSPGGQRLFLFIGPQRHSLVQLRFTSFAVTRSRGTSTRESAPMLGPRRKKGQDKSWLLAISSG